MSRSDLVMLAILPLGGACAVGAAGQETKVAVVARPPTDTTNAYYVSNRPPLLPSPFAKLPIGSIRPRGWLRGMLELEAEGMSGHLTEISPWCKAEGNAWMSPVGQGHSPWEELPYWLKGFGDLGYVLRNERITAEARQWIEATLSSQDTDGYFGPRANRDRPEGPDVWPNMIMLNCLQSFFEATGDGRVLPLMARYFRWQLNLPDEQLLKPEPFWQRIRAGDNLESIYWLYNRTGEPWLLELAARVHANTADWTGGIPSWHGVNICQGFRQPGVHYVLSRDPADLRAAERNYDTVIGIYGQAPGGMFGADENCREGYVDPRQGAESCSIVEFMHSFEMLTKITGDPLWADRCEEVALNTFPAAQPPDQRGLHYLTGANMVQLDQQNKSPGLQNGGCMLAYDPYSYRCCQHNIAHGWPYYAEELWLATPDNGLCASLYAASEVSAQVGDGTMVRIEEATDYPFAETITFTIATPQPVRFPLYLRIPRWCEAASVALNGEGLNVAPVPLTYVVIEREWSHGDRVRLQLPMRIALRRWAQNQDSVSVDRGPLTYSLRIGEEWVRYAGTDAWPALEVYPTTPWNYGLVLEGDDPTAAFGVIGQGDPASDQPFTVEAAPLAIRVPARRIPEWQMQGGLVGLLQPSPAQTSEPVETVTLVPMGCARLRVSAFPTVSDAPDAHRWVPPPEEPLASHCNPGDTTVALNDGLLPADSNDHNIPRMTWWDHRGTEEWVQYDFDEPRELSACEVYWFDDTGGGQCRVPASWQLLRKDGQTWRPVEATAEYGVAVDRFNRVTFRPVTTTGLRLQVQLQDGFSGGILEWRVE